MIQRQLDATLVNEILNDPYVRPDVAPKGEGALDLTARVLDRRNYFLFAEHGGCAFYPLIPGVYEVHTQVLSDVRGDYTMRLALACMDYMFTATDAYEIVTRVPEGHIAAKAGALKAHMRYEFTRPKNCFFRERLVDSNYYGVRIQDWAGFTESSEAIGEWFHRRLHEEALRLGITEPPHENDPNHNRYVGAAVAMFNNGLGIKAETFYNRWAAMSRHTPVKLISANTILTDIGFVVFHEDGNIEVRRQN